MNSSHEEWHWERTAEEVDALYRLAVSRSGRWVRIAVSAVGPLGLGIVVAVMMPDLRVWGLLVALGVGTLLVLLRTTRLARRARVLRWHLERRGLGFESRLSVIRQPWGLEIRSADGFVRAIWSRLSLSRQGPWTVVEHDSRPLVHLPEHAPLDRLLQPPELSADSPPPEPEGSVAWTFELQEQRVWGRASGLTGWRANFGITVAVQASIGLAGVGIVLLGGRVGTTFAIAAGLLLLWRLWAHLRWLWGTRPVPLGTRCASHVGPDGVWSSGLGAQIFTPWSRLRIWREQGDYVFIGKTVGAWHMVPREAVPSEASTWFRGGQEARRAERQEEFGPSPPVDAAARDNPFEPPVRSD